MLKSSLELIPKPLFVPGWRECLKDCTSEMTVFGKTLPVSLLSYVMRDQLYSVVNMVKGDAFFQL